MLWPCTHMGELEGTPGFDQVHPDCRILWGVSQQMRGFSPSLMELHTRGQQVHGMTSVKFFSTKLYLGVLFCF